MTSGLLALALPALAGMSLVRWADARRGVDLATVSLWLGVGLPLGAGLAGVLAWLWLVAGGSLGAGSAVAEGLVFAAIAALGWRARGPAAAPRPPAPRPQVAERAALVASVAGIGIVAAIFFSHAPSAPHGDWDAWAIWNLHARFLARGAEEWRLLFRSELAFSHNEYPLLLPAVVARTWACGARDTAAPMAVAALFTLAAPLAVLGAVACRAGAVAGAVATLLLTATGEWSTWGLSQNADVPLAALVAAGAACLALAHDEGAASRRWLALCGGLLGLAALTKDEGVVYLVAAFGWTLVRSGRAGALASAGALAAGFAVPVMLRVHFHAVLAPGIATLYTSGQGASSLASRVLDAPRWTAILSAVPRHLPGLSLYLPLAAIAVPWLLGARPRDAWRSPALAPVLAGYPAYLLAYAVSAIGGDAKLLSWHIATSAPRILLHPWPALLIALLALVPCDPRSSSTTARPAASR